MTIDEAIKMLQEQKSKGSKDGVFITFVGDDDFGNNLSNDGYEKYSKMTEEEKASLHSEMAIEVQEWFEEQGLFGKCFRTALVDKGFDINKELHGEYGDLTFLEE